MNKNIIFSHESDIDGLGCVVLAKLAFIDLDYQLFPNLEVLEEKFRKYIEYGTIYNYDNIYVTDLALYDPSLTLVNESLLKNKVHIFDHHERAIKDKMDRYDFIKIVESDESGKVCATSLFYEYLIEKNILVPSPILDEFVNLTKLEDTWEWKKNGDIGIKAHDLAILFPLIGEKKYIESMIDKIKNNKLEFTEEEKILIYTKKQSYSDIINKSLKEIEYFKDKYGNTYAILFSDYENRNLIAEYLKENNEEEAKYIICVAIEKGKYGQKSYRALCNNIDVNEIAMEHGGGGHNKAASVNITKEQKEKSLTLERKEALQYLAESSFK